MSKKVIVFGAGLVGKAIAIDLSRSYQVTAADINKKSLNYLSENYNIQAIEVNLLAEDVVKSLVSDFDLVVSAVPGFMGYNILEAVIEAGKNIVDISFMPEDYMELNNLAAQNGVTVITDCGVAPGIPNLIAGYYNEIMEIENFEYFVGGLPKIKEYPFYYKAPFSPVDVIEEYTRPARFIQEGKLITTPAMSDPELMYFDNIGTLEAFNTDGLRSLLYNLNHIPNMKEKTLRYPGHVELMQTLKAAGFFDSNIITINNTGIRPIDFTGKLLIKNWELKPDEPEFVVMRINIKGKQDNEKKKIICEFYDEYNEDEKLPAMGRSTGYTATANAGLILEGVFSGKGVFPLELIGMDEDCFRFIMNYLSKRNLNYKITENSDSN